MLCLLPQVVACHLGVSRMQKWSNLPCHIHWPKLHAPQVAQMWPSFLRMRLQVTLSQLGSMFESAQVIMRWLSTCAERIAKDTHHQAQSGDYIPIRGAEFVQWRTPLGLPVAQPYSNLVSIPVYIRVVSYAVKKQHPTVNQCQSARAMAAMPANQHLHVISVEQGHSLWLLYACTCLLSRHLITPQIPVPPDPRHSDFFRCAVLQTRKDVRSTLQVYRLNENSDSVNSSKQRTAFPPNFVHSIDSSHMMMTAVACKQAGKAVPALDICFSLGGLHTRVSKAG